MSEVVAELPIATSVEHRVSVYLFVAGPDGLVRRPTIQLVREALARLEAAIPAGRDDYFLELGHRGFIEAIWNE